MMNILNKSLYILSVVFLNLFLTNSVRAEDTPAVPDTGRSEKAAEERLKEIVLEPGVSCINASCHAGMEKKKFIHAIGIDGMKCDRCHVIVTQGRHDFKKIPEVTRDLCAQCHREDTIPPEGLIKTPPKVISDNEENRLHKPFAEGKCTACHDAHSSDNFRHLKLPYPEGVYASYKPGIYALCGECHKDLDNVLSTPRTLSLTMFRNGNVNLHFRHIDKIKGRTCKVCHSPHGLENPKLLNNTFMFGQRMLTVDYEKTESGGQCATSCHRLAKYDRYKPEFNFIKTDPLPGENATEKELDQSRKDDIEREKEKAKKSAAEQ
ncbi:MAG: cytochrome c3 family protein [Nitrospirota bacterium]